MAIKLGTEIQTSEGATTYPITLLYDKVTVQCDGTQWFIIG